MLPGDGFRIAGDIVIILVTRRGGDEHRHGICAGDGNFIRARRNVPIGGEHGDARLEFQRTLDAVCLAVDAVHHQRGVIGPPMEWRAGVDLHADTRLLRRAHSGREGDLPRLVRGEMDHDDLVYRAGEDLALEVHAVRRIAHRGDRSVQVEVPAVIIHRQVHRKIQVQVSQRLVRHLAHRCGHHLLADNHEGVVVFAVENELARVGQGGERVGVVRVIRPALTPRASLR